MFKKMTAAQIEKLETKIINQASEWRKNMTAENVAAAIWNKYGYSATVRGGMVEIYAGKRGLIAKI